MTTHEVTADTVERLALWEMYTGFWSHTRPVVYLLGALALAAFGHGIWQRVKVIRMGRPTEGALDNPVERVAELLRYAIGQVRLVRNLFPGVFHLLVFWGFAVLVIGTTLTFIDEDFYRLVTGEKFIQGGFYIGLSFLLDLTGLLAVVGIVMAMVRRYFMKPESLSHDSVDVSFLNWILFVLITGFLAEGARIGVVAAHKPNVAFEAYSFVGYGLSLAMGNSPMFHKLFWSIHIIGSFAFIALIPRTKALHIFSSMANIYTRNLGPKEHIDSIPNMMERMEAGEETEMGYKRIEDLTWKEILSADSCTRCGRCQDVCPAYQTGKKLSPKTFIESVKEHWLAEIEKKKQAPNTSGGKTEESESAEEEQYIGQFLLQAEALMEGREDEKAYAISSEELWDCTNCMACGNVCPVFIERVPLIVQMRRELAMEFDDSDKEAKNFFKNMDVNANPWGMNPGERASWAVEAEVPTVFDNPDFEYLYWIGCMGGYDPRAIEIGKAFVKILKAAGVNFAILGEMELCCGDSLRRMGNEASFQALVTMFKQTVADCEMDASFAGKKVLTTCPHGYNTLKHEYPEFGFKWEVFHHTEFINQLIQEGKLTLQNNGTETAVLHDSCFLARYNDIIDEPRQILRAAGMELKEAQRSKDLTFCCGGGGGRAWLEEELDEKENKFRINFNRTDELIGCKAANIVSACPLCMLMLDEASKRTECEEAMANTKLLDIAEVVASRLKDG